MKFYLNLKIYKFLPEIISVRSMIFLYAIKICSSCEQICSKIKNFLSKKEAHFIIITITQNFYKGTVKVVKREQCAMQKPDPNIFWFRKFSTPIFQDPVFFEGLFAIIPQHPLKLVKGCCKVYLIQN